MNKYANVQRNIPRADINTIPKLYERKKTSMKERPKLKVDLKKSGFLNNISKNYDALQEVSCLFAISSHISKANVLKITVNRIQ